MDFVDDLNVVIVGAGASGVGLGVIFRELKIEGFALLERYKVGASFSRWSKETRFITPSFASNAFGLLDLNSIALNTSPAYSLGREHPSGQEYARYLNGVAKHFDLPVRAGVDVKSVRPVKEGFIIETSVGLIRSRFVVWAAGEFQYPRLDVFPGAQLCLHNSQVRSWSDVAGDNLLIIGGSESGIDAAVNLCNLGKRVRVLDKTKVWESRNSDPSRTLSPYTFGRLTEVADKGLIKFFGDMEVARVEREGDCYVVYGESKQRWTTQGPPILATGFTGSHSLLADLFEWNEQGSIVLNRHDESTRTKGLFVLGPGLRQEGLIFCFIYKFRQRFAVVAQAIAKRLGIDTKPLKAYRRLGMFLDDLSCCARECSC